VTIPSETRQRARHGQQHRRRQRKERRRHEHEHHDDEHPRPGLRRPLLHLARPLRPGPIGLAAQRLGQRDAEAVAQPQRQRELRKRRRTRPGGEVAQLVRARPAEGDVGVGQLELGAQPAS